MRTQVWSCGGGTQSAAIAALIVQGRLPKPDVAVIVDTNREKSGTWAYFDAVLRPELMRVGVDLQRISRASYATVDLYSTNGETLLLPVFTTQGGTVSKMDAFCSNEWKQRVVFRWLKEQGYSSITNWLGISRDEPKRIRAQSRAWVELRYPLIFDVPMRRADCVDLVAEMGWPVAPRSSCWMCPNMRNDEWRAMRESHPADFAAAVELEKEVRKRDPHAWFHDSAVPLDQVDFGNSQMALGENGCGGMCWV